MYILCIINNKYILSNERICFNNTVICDMLTKKKASIVFLILYFKFITKSSKLF